MDLATIIAAIAGLIAIGRFLFELYGKFKSSVPEQYIELNSLLKEKKWKEADRETREIMCSIAGRDIKDWLDKSSIKNFPCKDLRTIDELWVKHSNGHFGFSVQRKIYESLGGTKKFNGGVVDQFFDKVGWKVVKQPCCKKYQEYTFDLSANKGCFPSIPIFRFEDNKADPSRWNDKNYLSWQGRHLLNHLIDCNL